MILSSSYRSCNSFNSFCSATYPFLYPKDLSLSSFFKSKDSFMHSQQVPSVGSQVKRFPYDHRLSILKSARSLGFDEAIVINEYNKISEAAVSNLLLKINGQWVTPPLTDGALPGVVRALVLENCDVSVRSIDISEMQEIESAFLIGSLRIAQSIDSIDSRVLVQSSDFKREIQAMALRTSVG